MYYMSHIPATAVSVEVKGLVDGRAVKGWKVVPKREAPADSETAIEINLVQRRSSTINLSWFNNKYKYTNVLCNTSAYKYLFTGYSYVYYWQSIPAPAASAKGLVGRNTIKGEKDEVVPTVALVGVPVGRDTHLSMIWKQYAELYSSQNLECSAPTLQLWGSHS